MKTFKHLNAKTINEACKWLQEAEGKAKVIAGGTDLLGELKDQIFPDYPETIINLKTIQEMAYIEENADGLKIGAMAKLADIAESPAIKRKYKILSEAALSVATPGIRNMGTLGGNLCQDVRCWYYRYPHQIGGRLMCSRKKEGPCLAVAGDNRYHAIMGGKICFAVCPSDTATALSALDATLKVQGSEGERTIAIRDFYTTLGNVLKPDELVTEIQLPPPVPKARQTFIKYRLRQPIDFAVVSVAAIIRANGGVCQEARIALGGVAPTPVRALKAEAAIQGEKIGAAMADKAAETALEGAVPLKMNAYKIEIAKTLVKRAIIA